jgi:hypothetical protein
MIVKGEEIRIWEQSIVIHLKELPVECLRQTMNNLSEDSR